MYAVFIFSLSHTAETSVAFSKRPSLPSLRCTYSHVLLFIVAGNLESVINNLLTINCDEKGENSALRAATENASMP